MSNIEVNNVVSVGFTHWALEQYRKVNICYSHASCTRNDDHPIFLVKIDNAHK